MYPRFNFRFMHGIEPQFLALQKGFNELIPQQLLKSFDERELELVIGGLGKIDLEDWKGNTRLKNCQPETKQVCGAYTKKNTILRLLSQVQRKWKFAWRGSMYDHPARTMYIN